MHVTEILNRYARTVNRLHGERKGVMLKSPHIINIYTLHWLVPYYIKVCLPSKKNSRPKRVQTGDQRQRFAYHLTWSPKVFYTPIMNRSHCPQGLHNSVFCGHFVAGDFFHEFFRPKNHHFSTLKKKNTEAENGFLGTSTYISPKATIQIVCQTPKPIRGVTPRYKPRIPLF